MSLEFAKLFFINTPEQQQVLITKQDLNTGPSIQIRVDFPGGPEIKTKSFALPQERDVEFNSFTLAEAQLFFARVQSVRTSFGVDREEVVDA